MREELISKQMAIEAFMEILDRPNHAEFLYTDEICRVLNHLPSAQPEIIRCKDCKFYTKIRVDLKNGFGICSLACRHLGDDGFCSEAERRTE
jgi:hypothetical protein